MDNPEYGKPYCWRGIMFEFKHPRDSSRCVPAEWRSAWGDCIRFDGTHWLAMFAGVSGAAPSAIDALNTARDKLAISRHRIEQALERTE